MRCSLVSVLLALLSRAALCARTSLLLKTHRPTDAMLKRICHLDVERRLSNFTAPFFLQYYLPDKKTEVMPFHEWCANDVAPVYTLHPQSLSDVFGEIGPDIHFRRWALGSVHELAFHAMHRDELDYDFLWVIEQARRRSGLDG